MSIIMKSAVIAFLICLLALHAEGQHGNNRSCKCLNKGVDIKNPKVIKKYQVFEASPSCPNREIVVETQTVKELCVDPGSRTGKFIYKKWNEKKQAVKTTTPSTTSTPSSVHMTSTSTSL